MSNRNRLFYSLMTLALAAGGRAVVAGQVDGPTCASDRVDSHSTVYYESYFRAGEPAAVSVSGDGDTDLDLYIYDEYENLIASDTDLSDQCIVGFTPKWTGEYRIEIRNLGNVYNAYRYIAN